MIKMSPLLFLAFPAIFLLDAQPSLAKKRRQHFAHVHGEAQMSVAIDGKEMEVLFQTPAEGVLGFEHEPNDDKEKKILEDSKEKLKNAALGMIGFSKDLQCSSRVEKLDIELAQFRRSKMDERLGLPGTAKGHGDIKAIYKISCSEMIKDVTLSFDPHQYFERIKKTKIVVLTETKQWSKTVELKSVSFEL